MSINLKSTELLLSPHPEPYCNIVISLEELKQFINSTINLGKQPIIIFGANWCPDARLLEGTLQLPTVKKYLEERCSLLNIDVGRFERNTELLQWFEPTIVDGIPRVFILDLHGNALNLKSNDRMRTAREQSSQEIFNYFQEYL